MTLNLSLLCLTGSKSSKGKSPATTRVVKEKRLDTTAFAQELGKLIQRPEVRSDTIEAIDAENRLRSEAQIGADVEKSRGSATPKKGKGTLREGGVVPQVPPVEEEVNVGLDLNEFADSFLSGGEHMEMQGSRQMSDASRGSDSTPGIQSRRVEAAEVDATKMGPALASTAEPSTLEKGKGPQTSVGPLRTEKCGLSSSEGTRGGVLLRKEAGGGDQPSYVPGTLPVTTFREMIQNIPHMGQSTGGMVGGVEVPSMPAPITYGMPFSPEQVEYLKNLMDQFMKTNLTGGWPIDSFKGRIDSAFEGQSSIRKKMEEIEKTQKDSENQMAATLRMLQEEKDRVKRQAEEEEKAAAARAKLFEILQEDVNSALSKYEFTQTENGKLGSDLEDLRKTLNKDISSLIARVEGLEGSRREERTRQGMENVPESNRLRMEGGEIILNAIISRGLFPSALTEDPTFMRLIKDKDGFFLALEKADAVRRVQGEHRRFQERYPPPRGPGDAEDRNFQGRREGQGDSNRPRR